MSPQNKKKEPSSNAKSMVKQLTESDQNINKMKYSRDSLETAEEL